MGIITEQIEHQEGLQKFTLMGNPVIFLNGGLGGQGAHCISHNANGNAANESTGNIGTTYQDWFNSGVFDITQENIINLGNQNLIIRF
ncbi:hypothetical protein N9Y36_06230 [Ulvibacter sp.]|nr:hypothetical protein [Ulvibacter sp.]